MLEIIYRDEHLIAINKPHGLLVHRSPIAADASEFALQLLRDQIGMKVNPVHRIDRKTGGILLFAFNKEVEIAMQKAFMENQVSKKYLAIVRGHTPDAEDIDYPLRKENGTLQDAFTSYTTLKRAELDIALGKHPTSRYSLVEAVPATGRMHQLRKHLSHIFHPIIGDRTHGCNKQNKLFLEQWAMTTMLLHASQLNFKHPITGEEITIKAALQPEFTRVMEIMRW
ncbi:pseudouridylate synthase [Mucilaginibacter rubeus]|uniref:Pseudouridylate synthase n=1 Tax=Mucilaginibacter rubeus TaxID=2027860 RepID=A0AAE6JCH8_9SPHI|nr:MULTISPECIES: pseudouridine synthase [Mucilaginibacter]QEM02813.1 pseudouridylate synthase [Mucilaginibacter rubeus]QEM15432.1 pseudouridylate synthase [Mucilaginibacter gossypii]QTE41839.1 pseudouridylate synthase [Mucilaginibacter rubeus]QTE48443.1 pseudouridylate synthase [Mucilaginibacter rubeus]QTE59829.1 pseudouridylate synthase [Mucilaginibacter rubeus]